MTTVEDADYVYRRAWARETARRIEEAGENGIARAPLPFANYRLRVVLYRIGIFGKRWRTPLVTLLCTAMIFMPPLVRRAIACGAETYVHKTEACVGQIISELGRKRLSTGLGPAPEQAQTPHDEPVLAGLTKVRTPVRPTRGNAGQPKGGTVEQPKSRTFQVVDPSVTLPLAARTTAIISAVLGQCVWAQADNPAKERAVKSGKEMPIVLVPGTDGAIDLVVRNTAGPIQSCVITLLDDVDPLASPRSNTAPPAPALADARPRVRQQDAAPTTTHSPDVMPSASPVPQPGPVGGLIEDISCLADGRSLLEQLAGNCWAQSR